MSDQRAVDLDAPPDGASEIRLRAPGCVVSVWLPADPHAAGRVIARLADLDFELVKTKQEAELGR